MSSNEQLKGRIINKGKVEGEAFVLDVPFSFIGDFDAHTGALTIKDHALFGQNIGQKILVCPTGKGGTIAPFIAYQAQQRGTAPKAIICKKVEPIICECAIAMNIPLLDCFDKDPIKAINNGQHISIDADKVILH